MSTPMPASARPISRQAHASASRRRGSRSKATGVGADGEEAAEAATISAERYADLGGKEEFILTVTDRGYRQAQLGL